MIFITRKKLEKIILELLKEIVNAQFDTLSFDKENYSKLEQQKGAIMALLFLAKKFERKKWI